MNRRAEPARRPGTPNARGPLIDRTWLGRAVLAIVVAGALLLLARVSIMAFSGGSHRIERYERDAERGETAPASPGTRLPP